MVDFQRNWLPRILGYGELIIAASIRREATVENSRSQASFIDYEELIEQIFGELEADTIVTELNDHLPNHYQLRLAIKKFIEGLESLRNWAEHSPDDLTPDQILSSRRWTTLRRLSKDMAEAARKSGFSSSDRAGG